jgi:HTH-type transcriptional regulator / antitoxin HigA
MIRNRRQYGITKKALEGFRAALRESVGEVMPEASTMKGNDLALLGQITTLEKELAHFDALEAGTMQFHGLEILLALPTTLIELRIAAKLTQQELAALLGVDEGQIQRYEGTDYQGASMTRILEVLEVCAERVQWATANTPRISAKATAAADKTAPVQLPSQATLANARFKPA